ncbi:MAG TPA: methylated-DNA--[protein]-cysteine S-methyltransferase [Polyangiaceae bacterium]|jgi:methylated-DNA-[protein]-cysteine S-methyltransferase
MTNTERFQDRFQVDHLDTPLGPLALVVDTQGRLCMVGWTVDHTRMSRHLGAFDGAPRVKNPAGITALVRAYFDGDTSALDRIPVFTNGTPFQQLVWNALREIPCGETWSYAQLAVCIGRPSAVRAVGLANGANPVGIVIPCHRVIGSDGSLTGYGGGIERKEWLLAHERTARAKNVS